MDIFIYRRLFNKWTTRTSLTNTYKNSRLQ